MSIPTQLHYRVDMDSPDFKKFRRLERAFRKHFKTTMLYSSNVERVYRTSELESAQYFSLEFEPLRRDVTGEDSGTRYNDASACAECGHGGFQVGVLKLPHLGDLKNDLTITYGGEVIISKRARAILSESGITGASYGPIEIGGRASRDYSQLMFSQTVHLDAENTTCGVSPFDTTTEWEEGGAFVIAGSKIEIPRAVYKCPKAHNLGLRLIGEVFLTKSESMTTDLFASVQTIGVRRGYIRPLPVFMCTQPAYRIFRDNGVTGITFNRAHGIAV